MKSKTVFINYISLFILNFNLMLFAQENSIPQKQYVKTKTQLETMLKKIIKQVKPDTSDSLTNKNPSSKAVNSDNIEIDGLIIDETHTKIGCDFFEYFYNVWEVPEGIKDYTIYISEKAGARMSTQIRILVNEIIVYQNFLQPRAEAIENAANQGVECTLQFLRQNEQEKKLLSGEDLKGTGIF